MKNLREIMRGCIPYVVAMALMYAVTLCTICAFELFCSVTGMGQEVDGELYHFMLDGLGLIATGCTYILYMIVFYLWYRRCNKGRGSNNSNQKLKVKDWVQLILLGILLQVVVSVLLDWVLPHFTEVYESYKELMDRIVPGNSVLSFVVTGFLAPVGEELVFRGVTISLMREKLSYWTINLLQAFLFGLYHMNIVQFVYAFAIGIVLGFVINKYGNLKACILVHGTINILANVIAFL